jgi:hypothetical protein
MTTTKARPVYVLKLRPEPHVADPVKALRAALKALLRRHGLKCLTAYEEDNRDTSS